MLLLWRSGKPKLPQWPNPTTQRTADYPFKMSTNIANICPVYVPKRSIFKKYWSLDWVFDNPTTANVNNLPSFYIMNQPRNFGISDNWTIWIFCKLWNKEILLYSRSFMMCSTRYTKTRNKAIQESELNFVLWNVIWLYSLTWNKNPETDFTLENG